MRKIAFHLFLCFCIFMQNYVFGMNNLQSLPAVTPPTQSATNQQSVIIKNLGKNSLAHLAAWVSLVCSSSVGIFLSYKTSVDLFNQLFQYLPLNILQGQVAQFASLAVVAPISIAALIKFAPLSWHFYYMIYAGERLSPFLAQIALHDLSVYVHHLKIIKLVQQELSAIIQQINQAANARNMKIKSLINPALINQLEDAVFQNDAYVQQIIAQLHQFLSDDEINYYIENGYLKHKDNFDFSIATDLQAQTHGLAQNVQVSDVDLGYDATVLNQLITELIAYWQQYTTGLAEGINNQLQFCQNVYFVEQIIINWFDRSLASA